MAKKTKASLYGSVPEVDAAFAQIVELELDAMRRTVAIRQKIAALQAQMVEVAGAIPGQIKAIEEQIKLFGQTHPELFKRGQTLELNHGAISFRKSNPSVKTTGKHSEEGALQQCRDTGYQRLIASTPRLNKEKILRDHREGKLTDEELSDLFLRIEQRTTWSVDPKVPEEVQGVLEQTETAAKATKKTKAA